METVTNPMAKICKLISTNPAIPDHELTPGDTVIIGRNHQAKVKILSCSRKQCTVTFATDGDRLMVQHKNSDQIETLRSGQTVSGPGFEFKIAINDRPCQDDDADHDPDGHDSTMTWMEHDSGRVMVGWLFGGGHPSAKIAAFDFDFTLVCTKSGKAFPTDSDDWKLFNRKLPEYLDRLCRPPHNYRFVVISNQLGISKGKVTVEEIQQRFESSLKAIGVPCLVLIATRDDVYRKPRTGLWQYLCQTIQPKTPVDRKQSFYVGDAAGRKKTALQKADFSSSDLFFAKNCGLHFLLPEQFVERAIKNDFNLENVRPFPLPENCFQAPREPQADSLLVDMRNNQKIHDIRTILPSSRAHCIIFCGLAGSGKSTFYENYLKPLGYSHISLDVHKSATKCMAVAKNLFEENKNCVVDNTNVDHGSRAKWLDLCRQYRITPLIFYFPLPIEHVLHNNKFRSLNGETAVPEVVIYTQNKKLEPPRHAECDSIFQVNFVPCHSQLDRKQLYEMFLKEK